MPKILTDLSIFTNCCIKNGKKETYRLIVGQNTTICRERFSYTVS